jgi:hypothetical protein
LGNITGATIGGFILALVEELGAGYISSGYRDAMGLSDHHRGAAVQAHRPVRAGGARRMKRVWPAFWLIVCSHRYRSGCRINTSCTSHHDRHFYYRGNEP